MANENTKRIVIDGDSFQGRQHLRSLRDGQTPGRLTSFARTIQGMGFCVDFASDLASGDGLREADLLIIPTWFQDDDVKPALPVIERFVEDGGGLFLLSNHSRAPSHPGSGHHTEQDGKLANIFGIKLLECCFRTERPRPGHTVIREAGPKTHPVLEDDNGRRVVESVVINNGCAIDPTSAGKPVLLFPKNVIDRGPNELNPDGLAFCWATETNGGRVLVTGDSGFIGEPNLNSFWGPNRRPLGPGLIDQGDNALFVQGAIRWLLGAGGRG